MRKAVETRAESECFLSYFAFSQTFIWEQGKKAFYFLFKHDSQPNSVRVVSCLFYKAIS